MVGTTSSGISDKLIDITTYAGAAKMLLHGKFTMRK
jgi:hypothetical protein